MPNFRTLYSEVPGWLPKISPQLAKLLVNRALHDIFDSKLWSFNVRESALLAPALLSTGTVSVTQYSNTATFNAAAITAINAIPLSTPVTKQQFRIGTGSGPVYNIISWNPVTGVMTFDRVYAEATNATASYQIYQCYYSAPESAFIRWISVYDPIQAYPLRLHFSKPDFDRWDPQRSSQSNPIYIGWFRFGTASEVSANLPLFEMWPHPTAQIAYQTLYQVRGSDLSADTDALPFAIPDELVLLRTRLRAYEWAMANAGTHPELKDTNWLALMQAVDVEYQRKWKDVARSDGETFLTSYGVRSKYGRWFPWTGAWMASHDFGDVGF